MAPARGIDRPADDPLSLHSLGVEPAVDEVFAEFDESSPEEIIALADDDEPAPSPDPFADWTDLETVHLELIGHENGTDESIDDGRVGADEFGQHGVGGEFGGHDVGGEFGHSDHADEFHRDGPVDEFSGHDHVDTFDGHDRADELGRHEHVERIDTTDGHVDGFDRRNDHVNSFDPHDDRVDQFDHEDDSVENAEYAERAPREVVHPDECATGGVGRRPFEGHDPDDTLDDSSMDDLFSGY